MAISLELWAGVCPAASHSSSCSTLSGSWHLVPPLGCGLRSVSFRYPPAPSRCRNGSERRGAITMRFEAENGRSSGGNQSKVTEESLFDSSQVDLSVLKRQAKIPPPQVMIPCLFMRGGTSRGTYFLKQHLPKDRSAIDKILLRVMGSPDPHQIDGLGGARPVTSKVAIISRSKEAGIDVDYTFAQVTIDRAYVDWEPSCGNILAGVGPAAIEMGIVTELGDPVTPVRIRATNNGALIEAVIQTPNHELTYDGDHAIDGVPGTAAPITLNLMHVMGSKTGKLLPTGQVRDVINGVEVTCIDVAMPIVIAKASSMGKTGYEKRQELDEDDEFFRKLEAIRMVAGRKMGLGDVTGRVIPKFVIVAEPKDPMANITARYFVPNQTHGAMAVTGAICVACCTILRGSVADDLSTRLSTKSSIDRNLNRVVIEHPSGRIQINLESEQLDVGSTTTSSMIVHRAGVMRTARLIFEGSVRVQGTGLENVPLHDESLKNLETYKHFQQQLHQNFRKLYRFKGLGKDHRDAEGEAEGWEGAGDEHIN